MERRGVIVNWQEYRLNDPKGLSLSNFLWLISGSRQTVTQMSHSTTGAGADPVWGSGSLAMLPCHSQEGGTTHVGELPRWVHVGVLGQESSHGKKSWCGNWKNLIFTNKRRWRIWNLQHLWCGGKLAWGTQTLSDTSCFEEGTNFWDTSLYF